MCVCIYMCWRVCSSVCVLEKLGDMRVCVLVYVCVCVCVCVCVLVRACVLVCVYVGVSAFVSVCTCCCVGTESGATWVRLGASLQGRALHKAWLWRGMQSWPWLRRFSVEDCPLSVEFFVCKNVY